jgi:hypothetical protein
LRIVDGRRPSNLRIPETLQAADRQQFPPLAIPYFFPQPVLP